MQNMKAAAREIIEKIKSGEIKTQRQLDQAKRQLAKKCGIEDLLPSSEILKYAHRGEMKKLGLLIKKPVRTISGVATVAVMPKPYPCPGRCIYCPQGENAPKSYTGKEPAARRAARNEYDAVAQVTARLKQLKAIGHSTDKIELIIMGGTFPAAPWDYQEKFVKGCFDAMNGGQPAKNLQAAQRKNETATHRCVGLTIETRPDFCGKKEIDRMLALGCTRVELGVQTLSDAIYERVNRGHTVKDVATATKLLKDSGLKVLYHIMPGLFQTPAQDLRMMRELFSNSDFRPDMLKIYPTLVIRGTKLYEMWKAGKYKPLTNEKAAALIAKMQAFVPSYVRIMRIQRDIPANLIEAGVQASNLRQLVDDASRKLNIKCRCIRCREAGHKFLKSGARPQKPVLRIEKYNASCGKDYFVSVEDKKQDILIGYLRLRIPAAPFRRELKDAAVVRELKVVGTALSIGKRPRNEFQHRGFGKILMRQAEEIARAEDAKKIAVTAAIGTRAYYKKLGYKKDGAYVSKKVTA